MSAGPLGSALETQADLAKTLLGGELKQVDQAMQGAKVAMQMKVQGQETANTQAAVAMMTGVGGQLNTVV